jgi:O-antigen/teichoic acid export membrane protein
MRYDPGAARAALRRHHRALAGIVDQAVVGAGNLAIGLMVLRASTKEEYGLYSLCYMTVILLNGFSNAVFVAQLTVSYHERPADRRDAFAAALLCAQLLVGVSVATAGLAVAGLLPDHVLSPDLRRLAVVAILACPVVMAHDFLRGYCFLVERPARAIALDLILILGWCAGTAGLVRGAGLAPPQAALMAFGAAAFASTGTGLVLSRLPLRSGWAAASRAVASVWEHARWALSGSAVTALQNQGHVYLLGWLGSAEAIAELNAARMLMMPMGLVILGVARTLTPTLARQAAEGRFDAMRQHARRSLIGVLAVIGLYSAAMLLGEEHLIAWVLGARYEGIAPLVALWMVILLLQAVDSNLSAVMQVAKRFRELMLINAWMVVPVLAGVIPMIPLYGAKGNLVVVVAGYVGVVLLLGREAHRAMAGLERGPLAEARNGTVSTDRPTAIVQSGNR